MFQKFQFYLKHSINDMRVNGQRTFFALLCIASGVAVIVALQNLGVMATTTLTTNLQAQNRGDLRISSIFGADVAVNAENVTNFLDERFPGETAVTSRESIENFGDLLTGGDGTVLSSPLTGRQAFQSVPAIVDAAVYPFYDEIVSTQGVPLAEMIQSPTDIVLSEETANELQAKTGDTVRVRGSDAEFTVTGIVETEQEISGFEDFLLGLFGYYYIDREAVQLFDELEIVTQIVTVRIDDAGLVDEINDAVSRRFPVDPTTTEDLLELNEEIAAQLSTTVTVMGLLALLLGTIGIINTMQVVVRRRTLEIAVLKTVGLQANQVTLLFLVQAFLMGVIGSIAGALLGSVLTYLIQGFGTTLTGGQAVVYRLTAEPIINGIIVGTLVTTVFGFLPTLSAGQVRPGIVLRPSSAIVPRAGCLRTLLVLVFMIAALAVVTQTILGSNFLIAVGGVLGAFIIAGLLYLLLWVMIWVVGRFTPSFGMPALKMSLRQMLASKPRGAITLLALVVGVFSLSTITLFAESFTNLLNAAIATQEETVFIQQPFGTASTVRIEEAIQSVEAVESYTVLRSVGTNLQSVRRAGGEETSTGTITSDARNYLNEINAVERDELNEFEFEAGGQLTEAGQVVLRDAEAINALDLEVGDTLVYGVFYNRNGEDLTEEIALEIVGIRPALENNGLIGEGGPSNEVYALLETFPGEAIQRPFSFTVSIPEEDFYTLSQAVTEVSDAFVLDLRLISNLIDALLDQFRTFPTLVAVLGLIVGGVVIANSVALATMERRREIAVMKSVGLQRERVLGMLLLENGLLGLVGGLIGVGIGLVVLVVVSERANLPLEIIPFGTGFLLMSLCIVVALVAALTTAWSASGEKPLNVLRYE
jgi:ABC-type antimicrobial peptide transport system permease subunit